MLAGQPRINPALLLLQLSQLQQLQLFLSINTPPMMLNKSEAVTLKRKFGCLSMPCPPLSPSNKPALSLPQSLSRNLNFQVPDLVPPPIKKQQKAVKICTFEGCTKLARGNKLCKGHGGGKRCEKDTCGKSARSGSGFCVAHGGGRRCTKEGCSKGAEGSTYLCVNHGGGRKCTVENCCKKDQGKGFCKAHLKTSVYE